jgi:glutathione peroxidase
MLPYDIALKTLDGQEQSLAVYRDRVLLVVNVASKCGFTPQYTGLENLYRKFRDRGFAVLGFPCNQFGQQEPGDEAQIAQFCSSSYQVSFPMFAKIDVNGAAAHPLYRYLTRQKRGLLGTTAIKWNFTKFLIDRAGEVVERLAPTYAPESIEPAVERLL